MPRDFLLLVSVSVVLMTLCPRVYGGSVLAQQACPPELDDCDHVCTMVGGDPSCSCDIGFELDETDQSTCLPVVSPFHRTLLQEDASGTNELSSASAVINDAGDMVIAWVTYDESIEVFTLWVRLLNASAWPISDAVRVDNSTGASDGNASTPLVLATQNSETSDFLIMWRQSLGLSGSRRRLLGAHEYEIFGQYFRLGELLDGLEPFANIFPVQQSEIATGSDAQCPYDVVSTSEGTFALRWPVVSDGGDAVPIEFLDAKHATCSCEDGYRLSNDSTDCVDIDECVEDAPCEQTCTNLNGTFECSCQNGFLLDSNNRTCSDVDECTVDTGGCAFACINVIGSYHCDCGTELVLHSDGHSCLCPVPLGYEHIRFEAECTDIDECALGVHDCPLNVTVCTNVEGSYECTCPAGYAYNASTRSCDDVDECFLSLCEHLCANTDGSFNCSCADGYTLGTDNLSCDDNDECADDNGGCDLACVNDPGSFHCDCGSELLLAPDGHSCLCPVAEGFFYVPGDAECTDIDECATGGHDCPTSNPLVSCSNTVGSFECLCSPGYTFNSSTTECDDIDECLVENGGCEHSCLNSQGSFTCACSSGYSLDGDGFTCNDINECLSGNGGCDLFCINDPGSHHCDCGPLPLDTDNTSCVCPVGFEHILLTTGCQDIDECLEGTDGCEYDCSNTQGSYQCLCDANGFLNPDGTTCSCNSGWEPSGTSPGACENIDECERGTDNCASICHDTPGSFQCFCPSGYVENAGAGRCDDIDECASGNGGCEQICTNLPGTFECSCNDGYSPSGSSCSDVDECASANGGCNMFCTNTVGSYTCSCDALSTLDGDAQTCVCPGGYLPIEGTGCTDVDECALGTHVCDGACENRIGTYACQVSLGASTSYMNILFSDDFENDLSAWVGQDYASAPATAVLASDPSGLYNTSLRMSDCSPGGDAFSTPVECSVSDQCYISFRSRTKSGNGQLKGAVAASYEHMFQHNFYVSGDPDPSPEQWRRIEYVHPQAFSNEQEVTTSGARLMFNAYSSSADCSDATDAYVDDVVIHRMTKMIKCHGCGSQALTCQCADGTTLDVASGTCYVPPTAQSRVTVNADSNINRERGIAAISSTDYVLVYYQSSNSLLYAQRVSNGSPGTPVFLASEVTSYTSQNNFVLFANNRLYVSWVAKDVSNVERVELRVLNTDLSYVSGVETIASVGSGGHRSPTTLPRANGGIYYMFYYSGSIHLYSLDANGYNAVNLGTPVSGLGIYFSACVAYGDLIVVATTTGDTVYVSVLNSHGAALIYKQAIDIGGVDLRYVQSVSPMPDGSVLIGYTVNMNVGTVTYPMYGVRVTFDDNSLNSTMPFELTQIGTSYYGRVERADVDAFDDGSYIVVAHTAGGTKMRHFRGDNTPIYDDFVLQANGAGVAVDVNTAERSIASGHYGGTNLYGVFFHMTSGFTYLGEDCFDEIELVNQDFNDGSSTTDFEYTEVTGWTGGVVHIFSGSAAWGSVYAVSGSRFIGLQVPGTVVHNTRQDTTLVAGRKYQLQMSLQYRPGFPANNARVYIDSAGGAMMDSGYFATPASWTHLSFDFVATHTTGTIILECQGLGGDNTCFFDRVRLVD